MRTYRICIGILVLFAIVMPALGISLGKIIANEDLLLKKFELTNREFLKMEIGAQSVYWSPRTIGNAIVEGDGLLYQIDTGTGNLIAKRDALRSGLPDDLSTYNIRDAATLPVQAALSSKLYFISPESEIYRLNTQTDNPCWVVWSQGPDGKIITIFDAVTGDEVGYGISPPYDAYSMGGPDHGSAGTPNCGEYYYNPYATNARDGFNDMGYSTLAADRPDRGSVQSQIESSSIALFYELDHGGSYNYLNKNCDASSNYVPEHIFATDIEAWMDGFTKMPFTFLGSCEGMCHTDDNSFSYEFRKGSTENTVSVGYCHMDWSGAAGEGYDCSACWGQAINWQTRLFDYMQAGDTAKAAFDKALADVGVCGTGTECMRFLGDEDMKFVSPLVTRGSLPTADAGDDQTVEQTNLAGSPVTLDGSGSTEPNAGATLTYAWTWSGGSATGVKPTVSLPLGTTVVTLVVEDGFSAPEDLADRTDTVSITVRDTTPPSFTLVPADVTAEQATAAGTVVPLSATATDICDASPTVTSNAPAIFPLGTTTVTFTATDDSGNSATATTKVTIVDTTPPAFTSVPEDVTVEQETAAGTEMDLAAFATDICDASPTVTSDAPAIFPLGTTTVTFTATDFSGNAAMATMKVTVVDTTPPVISVAVSPDTLWSPNHKMADIKATVTATDICDAAPDIVLTSIMSNEPDDAIGMGDGNTVNDIQGATFGSPDYGFQLRAERDGKGTGRVYTITYTATDDSGNSARASATVKVPHNGEK